MSASTARDWRGDSDGTPKFGRKAALWFARSIRAKLLEMGGSPPYSMYQEEVEPIVERFAADPLPYVKWEDADEYRGQGWPLGVWKIQWTKVMTALSTFLLDCRRDTALGGRDLTLDVWLKADIENNKSILGRNYVWGGENRLPKELRTELTQKAVARRRKWPLVCRECGGTFLRPAKRRGKMLRCPKCLAGNRSTGSTASQSRKHRR